jgi:hypothetical protein
MPAQGCGSLAQSEPVGNMSDQVWPIFGRALHESGNRSDYDGFACGRLFHNDDDRGRAASVRHFCVLLGQQKPSAFDRDVTAHPVLHGPIMKDRNGAVRNLVRDRSLPAQPAPSAEEPLSGAYRAFMGADLEARSGSILFSNGSRGKALLSFDALECLCSLRARWRLMG